MEERYSVELTVLQLTALKIIADDVYLSARVEGTNPFWEVLNDARGQLHTVFNKVKRDEKERSYKEMLALVKDFPYDLEEQIKQLIIENAEDGFPITASQMTEKIQRATSAKLSWQQVDKMEKEMGLYRR
jgi:hypothetical protein